jgi:hypothetical protein
MLNAQGEATYSALSRKTSRVSGSAAVIVANCLTRAVSNLQGQTIRDARAKDTWERKACLRSVVVQIIRWIPSYEGRPSTRCGPSVAPQAPSRC